MFKTNTKVNCNTSLNLYINGKPIEKVSSCKYLGILIDENLNWDLHVDYVYKKIIRFTGIFYKLRSIVPKKCLCKLYYAFVFPYISYGVEIYANSCNATLDKLNKVNNKILRILLQTNFSTSNIDLYRDFNVLPIGLLYESKLLQLIFKWFHFNELLPEVFRTYFVLNKTIHKYYTRNVINLHISTVNSNFGQRCSNFRGSKLWNELPDSLKQLSSIQAFKKNIHNFLLFK